MPIDPNNLSGSAVMTFDDEFNALSLWNETSGTWTTTYPFADPAGNGSTLSGNGEQEWYINSNYGPTSSVTPWTVSNGYLHLTAAPASASIQPLIDNYQYTSGQLNTVHSFSQTYGYFEMRAELPAGQGLWPAFWLLPANGAWPPELDVMEVLENNPTTLYTTVHTASTGTHTQESVATTVPDTTTGFHTYGVDWESDYITWYFDGKAVDRVATPSDMNSPMYMLLNLAVGGYWPGNADATTPFPADMTVDWVRAYQSLPNGAGATLSPSTAVAATGTGDVLSAAGAPLVLAAGGAATSAAMLSTGQIAIGGSETLANGGGLSGIADLYSASGARSGGDVALTGWVGAQSLMSPQVTALPGGYWEITYAGVGAPATTEIYNSSGTLTFLDNAFTTGSPVFTSLADGSWVEASNNAPGRFEIVQADGQTTWLTLPTINGAQPTPSAVATLGDGGFVFSYAGSTELDRYSSNGGVHTVMQLASAAASAALGVAGFTDGVTEAAWLAAGTNGTTSLTLESFDALGRVQASAMTLAASVDATTEIRMLATGVHDQSLVLWSTGGTVYGAAFDGTTASAATALAPGALDGVQSVVLTDGDVALTWLETDNGVQHQWVEVVDPSTMQATRHDLGAADGSAHLVALQGGGFAESWHAGGGIEGVVYDGLSDYGATTVVSGDFVGVNGQGQLLAVATGGSGPATLQAYELGAASTTGGSGGTTGPTGPVATSPSTAVPATGTGDVLSAAGAAVAMSGGAATSAAMLSTGAIVAGGSETLANGAGFSGIADLYSASGAHSGGDVALTGWVGAQSLMSPQVTALPGGFWEVTYTGAGAPAGSEIYNASGTLTFLDNAFTSGSPVFTTLPDGSWVEASNNAPGRFEIVQADGRTDWFALPTINGGQTTPSAVTTLGDGGFVFAYAGSTELDRYSANGGVHTGMQLASAPVSAALGVAGLTDGVTEAAWLAAGTNGTTSLRLESFDALGQMQASAVTLAASVDATTEIRMLGTGVHDQSLALWSTGGTVYGAAFDGTTASAARALAPGALDGVQSVVLTDGDVALTWLETDNGVQHQWVEVVDPSTMKATRHDLGAAEGSAHLVALQGGGFAASWHAGGGIEGVVYDGLSDYGATTMVSGDFVGVNSQGQLLAVATGGPGPATLQAYDLGGKPSGGSSVGGYTDAHDFLGDGHAQVLMYNVSNGDAYVGEVASGQLTFTQVAQFGSEWKFAGGGDFLGQGHDQFLILNGANGDLDVGSVSNGQTTWTEVSQLGAEWSLQGAGTYLGDGAHDFLLQNADNGDVDVGSVSGGQAQYTQVAQLGSEWKITGSGDFLGKGHDQFMVVNGANGDVDVGSVSGGQTTWTQIAQLGGEWKMHGAGDYLGDGKSQFLMENANNGDVIVGEVGANGQATYTTVAQLGSEWKFVGAADVLGQGHDQFIVQNTTNGDVEVANVVSGHAQFTRVGGLGSEWSFHM